MIGAGRHATQNLYPAFTFLQGASVTANAALSLSDAQNAARRHGIPASYTDWREMVSKEKPDGVLVCVGPDFHARTAMELMESGFHVFTEKPPATSLIQVREVAATSRRTGRICMTGFKKRFAPAGIRLKEIVSSGDFGEPSTLSVFRTRNFDGRTLDDCLRYVLDSTIHMFDLAAWLFGKAKRVRTLRKEPASFGVLVEFSNGAVGTMLFPTTLSNERIWEEVTVTGSGGVFARMENSTELVAFKREMPIAAYKPEWAFGSCHSSVEMGFAPELQAFVQGIRTGTTPDSSIETVLPGIALMEAVMQSLRSNEEVLVAEV
jgi:UDP-N-acetylglucosamine 3-dehydrogenase